jgi:hypothetical protein
MFSNTLSLCSFLNFRDQVSHPYRTIKTQEQEMESWLEDEYRVASWTGKGTAVEVAASGFPVNIFNGHQIIAGDVNQPEHSNAHNSFELSVDIGPAPTRLTHRNISEHEASPSPLQGT